VTRARSLAPSVRPWLAGAASVLAVVTVLPPVATWARQYAFAQALQFTVFAVITPALLALGMPLRGRRRGRAEHAGATMSPVRVAAGRLVPFIAVAITWRLPPLLEALATHPGLSAAELVTLAVTGLGVWLAISGRAPLTQLPRPLRGAMAAAAMWTIWIIAYITGMSSVTLLPRNPAAANIISAAADRQLAAAALWAVPAICFAPAVYFLLISWLGERDELESQQHGLGSQGPAGLAQARRPPGGWRHRGAR
jgi:Cytochrome c oxidase caa3 assembly factor (Caa3_CtaG)